MEIIRESVDEIRFLTERIANLEPLLSCPQVIVVTFVRHCPAATFISNYVLTGMRSTDLYECQKNTVHYDHRHSCLIDQLNSIEEENSIQCDTDPFHFWFVAFIDHSYNTHCSLISFALKTFHFCFPVVQWARGNRSNTT